MSTDDRNRYIETFEAACEWRNQRLAPSTLLDGVTRDLKSPPTKEPDAAVQSEEPEVEAEEEEEEALPFRPWQAGSAFRDLYRELGFRPYTVNESVARIFRVSGAFPGIRQYAETLLEEAAVHDETHGPLPFAYQRFVRLVKEL